MRDATKKNLRQAGVIVVSIFVVGLIFRYSTAGSLTPSAAPASTMQSLQNVYDALASSGFDSSGVTASRNGSALQISKCIIQRITGSTCP